MKETQITGLTTTAILWYDKEVKDTLLSIDVFETEEKARGHLRKLRLESPGLFSNAHPRIAPRLPVFLSGTRWDQSDDYDPEQPCAL